MCRLCGHIFYGAPPVRKFGVCVTHNYEAVLPTGEEVFDLPEEEDSPRQGMINAAQNTNKARPFF